ncbi:M48 family metallopeptidase [Campylobacter ureolyticus]|uniref:M48 family metallopeptidase n=1 Tax=Campylobacter ureolyticus TaxID=827 RepID=UPI0022B3635E|nr:SprT family zinc-dependent metalloprotease [Campylobacter ureolyticus]MCZ6174389.1 SprT family zinc-dependent metalloprotease [Campylobacter ureolyticus]
MDSKFIKFDKFDIKATKKRVKYARLRVDRNGDIYLTLPILFPKFMVLEFLNKNKAWIENRVNFIKSKSLPENKTMLLGQIYSLKFDESFKKTEILCDEIRALNLNEFIKFKKDFAKNEYMKFINLYLPIINKPINKLTIRDMKTRWGSCNFKKGYINLALNLVEKSPELIEYVVLHELTHLIFPHHQKSFYDYIANLMPDFRDREKRLKG